MADDESPEKDALLEKVEAVLDCVQPVYKSENFDSLKQVRNTLFILKKQTQFR
jgi:hypothetical protein